MVAVAVGVVVCVMKWPRQKCHHQHRLCITAAAVSVFQKKKKGEQRYSLLLLCIDVPRRVLSKCICLFHLHSVLLWRGVCLSGVFREVLSVISKRGWWLVALNWMFFGFVLVGSLLGGLVSFSQSYLLPASEVSPFSQASPLLLFGFIFVFNLVFSGFVFVTLTGLVFFPLSPILLSLRGFLWGILFAGSPTSKFLAILPTLVLEGEGYVFAALGGLILGVSWLKPQWAYAGESFSRSQALRKAWTDCLYVYILVVLLLLAAAVVETLTLVRL